MAAACDSAPPVSTTGAAADPRFQAVLSKLEAELVDHDIPTASVAIVENGQLVAAAGVGEDVTPATTFRAGSVGQWVTAATALALVDSGELDLSAPATQYVPFTAGSGAGAGGDPSAITIAQLLSHSSGIANASSSDACTGSRADWFAARASQPLWSPPGEVFAYSTGGYALAGWAIEAAAGAPFEHVASERVLGPAQMTTARFDSACIGTRPATGLVASAIDLAHFTQVLLAGGDGALSADAVTALETGRIDTQRAPAHAIEYGFGTYTHASYKGFDLVDHTGNVLGGETSVWMVPSRGFAVVVMYGAESASAARVAALAFDEYLGTADVAAPTTTTAPAAWAQFAGHYDAPAVNGAADVSFANSALALAAPAFGVDHATLAQVGGNEFSTIIDDDTHDLTFYTTPTAQYLVTTEGTAVRAP